MSQLKVSHVTKSFEGNKILEDVSIELHDQELVGLLGISGGGKTTLLRNTPLSHKFMLKHLEPINLFSFFKLYYITIQQ